MYGCREVLESPDGAGEGLCGLLEWIGFTVFRASVAAVFCHRDVGCTSIVRRRSERGLARLFTLGSSIPKSIELRQTFFRFGVLGAPRREPGKSEGPLSEVSAWRVPAEWWPGLLDYRPRESGAGSEARHRMRPELQLSPFEFAK